MDTPKDLAGRVEAEVKRVHAFISAWFRGDVPNDPADFRQQLEDCWDATLVNIQPSSETPSGEFVLSEMRAAHGANPDFEIEISQCRVRQTIRAESGWLVVATYRELQRGARNTTPSENTRVSSVVFECPDATGGLLWRHIHETGTSA